MSDPVDDVRRLMAEAAGLAEGPIKLALLEEAVGRADSAGDPTVGLAVRRPLLQTAYQAGRADVLLVQFAWCLGYADRRAGDDGEAVSVLWQYRWVVDVMPKFAEVSRAQIEAAVADMAARYAAAGFSARPVHVLARRVYQRLGDRRAAAAAHRRIGPAAVDDMADGPGQERAFAVEYRAFRRRDDAAVALAAPLLGDPRAAAHDRIDVSDDVLMPLARLGRAGLGRRLQRSSARLTAAHPHHVGGQWQHVDFLATVGDLDAAAAAFDRQFPVGVARPGRLGRWPILRAGLFLCERLVRAGRADVPLKVPAGLVPGAAGDRAAAGVLGDWLDAEVRAVAGLADARNGNDFYTREVARLAAQHRLADRYAANRAAPPPAPEDAP